MFFKSRFFLKEKQLGVPKITGVCATTAKKKVIALKVFPITIEEFVEVLVHG